MANCPRCGYLLHKLEGDVCPECGTPIGERRTTIPKTALRMNCAIHTLALLSVGLLVGTFAGLMMFTNAPRLISYQWQAELKPLSGEYDQLTITGASRQWTQRVDSGSRPDVAPTQYKLALHDGHEQTASRVVEANAETADEIATWLQGELSGEPSETLNAQAREIEQIIANDMKFRPYEQGSRPAFASRLLGVERTDRSRSGYTVLALAVPAAFVVTAAVLSAYRYRQWVGRARQRLTELNAA